jgi:hypothetical protein
MTKYNIEEMLSKWSLIHQVKIKQNLIYSYFILRTVIAQK